MSCHCNGIGINVESVGVMPIRQMIEEITMPQHMSSIISDG